MTPDDYAAPAEIVQSDDSTLATKGLIAGLCLSIPLWALLAAAVWGLAR